jgi:hypothetical protein
MADLFDHYRVFLEETEKNMDRIVRSRSRGNEIRDRVAFQEFWQGVSVNPAMRDQWERRLAEDGVQRERDAIFKIVLRLALGQSRMDDREAA